MESRATMMPVVLEIEGYREMVKNEVVIVGTSGS